MLVAAQSSVAVSSIALAVDDDAVLVPRDIGGDKAEPHVVRHARRLAL